MTKGNLIIMLLLLGINQSLWAYPISPRPLRKLIMESELIVYANVIDIKEEQSEGFWMNAKAILVIQESLQGLVEEDTLEVYFTPGMMCPAPARYEKGVKTLAFLDKLKEKPGYTTHALSYGSKTLNQEGFSIYQNRIIEMQSILKIQDKDEKEAKTIEWLITCAENPYTRWEGTYELSPESDFMVYYDNDRDIVIYKHQLNIYQKARLRQALFKTEELTHQDLGLIDMITREQDEELLEFLKKKLKASNSKNMWYQADIMTRVAKLSDRDDLKQICNKIEALFFELDGEKKITQLSKKFIKIL